MIRTEIEISPHFKLHEFACACCDRVHIVSMAPLAEALEVFRYNISTLAGYDVPIFLTSAYRCKSYNAMVNGSVNSQHLEGKAADIRRIDALPFHDVLDAAIAVPAFARGGIGIYIDRMMRGWLHVDIRSDGPSRWAQFVGSPVAWETAIQSLRHNRNRAA